VRRRLPEILAILSLPVGLGAYLVVGSILAAVAPSLAITIVGLFLPLFAAGLAMIPFLVPWFDRKAKADLAQIRAAREAGPPNAGPPDARPPDVGA
jgi:hypothetical protein